MVLNALILTIHHSNSILCLLSRSFSFFANAQMLFHGMKISILIFANAIINLLLFSALFDPLVRRKFFFYQTTICNIFNRSLLFLSIRKTLIIYLKANKFHSIFRAYYRRLDYILLACWKLTICLLENLRLILWTPFQMLLLMYIFCSKLWLFGRFGSFNDILNSWS